MNLEEKEISWVGKSDSEIAETIFNQYQFIPKVDHTVSPTRAEHTVIQRGTDIEFLKQLATRNGFECYVDKVNDQNPIGYFKNTKLDEESQGSLFMHFDEKTNLVALDITLDGIRPMSVELKQKNALSGKTFVNNNSKSTLPNLGKKNLSQLFKKSMGNKPLPKILLSRHSTDDRYEMERIVDSVVDDGSWFIIAKGTVNASKYGKVLIPKKLVEINGIGDTFSGKYYVTKVTHIFTPESYVQNFEAKRNAIEL